MAQQNRDQDRYQDDMDMDTGMGGNQQSNDMDTGTGEKGGQATRDQSNTQETEDTTSGLRDEDLDTDLGSDF